MIGGHSGVLYAPQLPPLTRSAPPPPQVLGLYLCNFIPYEWGARFLSHTTDKVLVAPSSPPLCDPMDYSPPGSSVHGILQARILEWVATTDKATVNKWAHPCTRRPRPWYCPPKSGGLHWFPRTWGTHKTALQPHVPLCLLLSPPHSCTLSLPSYHSNHSIPINPSCVSFSFMRQ